MNSRTKIFNGILRSDVKPFLTNKGFEFDNSRTFRRASGKNNQIEIINFQLGVRSMEGKFTVNLGVYEPTDDQKFDLQKVMPHDCADFAQARLGEIIPAKLNNFNNMPILGFFFGQSDRWWRFTEDEFKTKKNMQAVVDILNKYGLNWLTNVYRENTK